MRCWIFPACLLAVEAVRQRRSKKDGYSRYDGQSLMSLTPCTSDVVSGMQKMLAAGRCRELSDEGLMLRPQGCAAEQVICPADVAQNIVSTYGPFAAIVNNDAGLYLRSASGVAKPYTGARSGTMDSFYQDWRNLDDRMARVQDAVAASNGVATMADIGKSVQNRSIYAIRIAGQGYQPGNPRYLYTFNLHAREWLAGMTGVYAVENMIAKAKADPNWLAGKEVVLVPMANPDGFVNTLSNDRFWRKNMRPKTGWFFSCAGTDLNRNFAKDWGGRGSTSTSTCSDTYIGTGSMSEPETKVLAELVKEAPLKVHVDVHAFSEMILVPWGWTTSAHPRRAEAMALGQKMQAAVESVNGVNYETGDNILYTASGTFSDYSTDLGALGYTYEVRPGGSAGIGGFAPSASIILPTCEEVFAGLLAAID